MAADAPDVPANPPAPRVDLSPKADDTQTAADLEAAAKARAGGDAAPAADGDKPKKERKPRKPKKAAAATAADIAAVEATLADMADAPVGIGISVLSMVTVMLGGIPLSQEQMDRLASLWRPVVAQKVGKDADPLAIAAVCTLAVVGVNVGIGRGMKMAKGSKAAAPVEAPPAAKAQGDAPTK